MTRTERRPRAAIVRARGFSLIELLIAMTIGVFVVFGLSLVFVNLKTTFTSQQRLADLQDSQRMALTVLTNVMQTAAYYPASPATNRAATLPALAAAGSVPAFPAGVGFVQTTSAAGNPVLAIRWAVDATEKVFDCLGAPTPASGTVVNLLTVDPSQNMLQCSTDGGTSWNDLVPGIAWLSVTYALEQPAGTQYVQAAKAAAAWDQVRAVRVQIDFANPFAGQPGMPTLLPWTQVIGLMNQL